MKKIFVIASLTLLLVIAACKNNQSSEMPSMSIAEHEKMAQSDESAESYDPEFEKLCKDRTPDNWMSMRPMIDGEFTSDVSCWGCMSDDGMNHYCNMEEYKKYLENQK